MSSPVCPHELPEPIAQDWYVRSRNACGCIVTDQDKTIMAAPPIWRKYIGMNLEELRQRGTFVMVQLMVPAGKSLS